MCGSIVVWYAYQLPLPTYGLIPTYGILPIETNTVAFSEQKELWCTVHSTYVYLTMHSSQNSKDIVIKVIYLLKFFESNVNQMFVNDTAACHRV